MKKIIIDPQNERAIEVRLNNSFGPSRGMSVLAYRQLVSKELIVCRKLTNIAQTKKLPRLVTLLYDILPALNTEEINLRKSETVDVINKVSQLLIDGFHVAIIHGILDVTCNQEGGFGEIFLSRFSPLCDKDCREDFWGTRLTLPCLVTMGLLEDMMNDINVDCPTRENLKKSKVIAVAKSCGFSKEKWDAFISSYKV